MSVSRAATVIAALAALCTAAQAADCPRPGTLGTSRVMTVDPATYPRVGLKSFPQTLPLADHEVVLTFDDGPAATTPAVLKALADQCVRATFFLVGKPASGMPAMVKRIAAGGHTVAHHTWTHKHLSRLPLADAISEIDKGIADDEAALNLAPGDKPAVPFFRFPFFESTPALLEHLQARGIAVFGADLWASDWLPMTPEQELKLITERLTAARKGIILFHDPRHHTAEMMAAFLGWLRDNHYRVVHIVPPSVEERAVASRAHGSSAQ
jgi:peptidoglycan/xylan/chitin deacetylase (PgdA/CDA1 family)